MHSCIFFRNQEKQEQARYYDAHVLEIQRRWHDIRGCRCLFLIRYAHDNTEVKYFPLLYHNQTQTLALCHLIYAFIPTGKGPFEEIMLPAYLSGKVEAKVASRRCPPDFTCQASEVCFVVPSTCFHHTRVLG